MQRVTQMHVTPDLLPEIKPAADVRLAVGGSTIEPGVFTKPADVRWGSSQWSAGAALWPR